MSALKDKLQSDLNGAIKSRNTVVAETIRMVLSAITNEEVAGKEKRELSDAEVITVLTREAKKRREAAEAFETGGRADRAAAERAEGEVIAGYLPAQLSESEIKNLIAETIAAIGASGPADMGKVMGGLKAKVAGKADGALVSSLVKEALNK
ncbi:MAG: GatB/YqeY domain-containing protein [Candidatus Nanopelagicaceae bacterium]